MSKSPPPTGDALASVPQTTMMIVSPDGDEIEIPTPSPERAQQAIGADINDRYVVWSESGATDLGVEPWVLYVYDRETRASRELARAPKIDGHVPPPPPGYTGPNLVGHRVFWAQVGGSFGRERVDIMGCDVRSCRPEVYIGKAAFPDAAGGELFAIRMADFTADHAAQPMSVVRLSLGSRKEEVIHRTTLGEESGVGGLAASSRAVIWISRNLDVSDEATATILDTKSGRTDVVNQKHGEAFGYPIATDRFVAWAEGSGTGPGKFGGYLFDLRTRKRWMIGNESGLYNIKGAGDVVSWQEVDRHKRGKPISYVVARLS